MVLNIKSLVFILFSAALISIFSMSSSFAVDAESLRSCDGNESTAACNGTCAVNANGAIVIQSNGMPADAGDTSSFRDSCNMIPDRYKVHMFKGGFCTANPAVGALLFTCSGRGVNFYGEPNIDSSAFRNGFQGVPLAGFFAGGEIGPVTSLDIECCSLKHQPLLSTVISQLCRPRCMVS